MSRVKRYPPWFAAIHAKSEEARKNGMSYGQYVAYEWDMAGRPKAKWRDSDEEETLFMPSAANTKWTESVINRQKMVQERREKHAEQQKIIETVRTSKNLTKTAFGIIIGVSPVTVLNWERGSSEARWDKLCLAFREFLPYVPDKWKDRVNARLGL